MHKIIAVLKKQLDTEIKNALEKLTGSNLDAIFKLTESIKNLERMDKGAWEEKTVAEDIVQKYSNGRYDHNIDALYDAYIEAKKKYKDVGDQGHRDKLMECVCRLMTEVYDMLSAISLDADFREEREEVKKRIKMLADM